MADHKLAASTTQWPSPHVIFALVKRRAQLSGEIEAAHEGLRKIFSESRSPLFRIMLCICLQNWVLSPFFVIPAQAAIGFTQLSFPPCGEGGYPALAG